MEGSSSSSDFFHRLSNAHSVAIDHGHALVKLSLPDSGCMVKKIWPRTVLPSHCHRWNTFEEILSYLISFESHDKWIQGEILKKPESGTIILYNKAKTRRYRNDGYDWKTRNTSTKTIREDRTKLKVCGYTLLYGCYTHCESNPSFHRRCYWLIRNPDIVLVHYLDTSQCKDTCYEQHIQQPLLTSLLAIDDHKLCQYISNISDVSPVSNALSNLAQQIHDLSTELIEADPNVTLSTIITYIDQKLLSKDPGKVVVQTLPPPSLPPHVLIINQAMRLMQLQARSSQYGDQSLLPKGINTLSSDMLYKAAATFLNKETITTSNNESNIDTTSTAATPPPVFCDSLGTLEPPSLNGLVGQSLEPPSLNGLVGQSLEPPSLNGLVGQSSDFELSPSVTPTPSSHDFNMESFKEFAHSLTQMRPLEEVKQLMEHVHQQQQQQQQHEQQQQSLQACTSFSDSCNILSDKVLQEILTELELMPPSASSHDHNGHQSYSNGQMETIMDNQMYQQMPPAEDHTHQLIINQDSLTDFPSLDLDQESSKLLLELSNDAPPLSPWSHYMSLIDNEEELQYNHHDNHHYGNQSLTSNSLMVEAENHRTTDDNHLDMFLNTNGDVPVSMATEAPLPITNLQFTNSFLQNPIEVHHSISPNPPSYPPTLQSLEYRSPSPSTPSQASVSSLSTAGGDSYLDETPLVAELCELLSESPNVQDKDFAHLSLTNTQQQELLQASRVIQNTLRKCGSRHSKSSLKEKDAALLIERYYKDYRDIKRKREQAARCIQNQYRLYRKRNSELQRAALFIQQLYRFQRHRKYSRKY